MKTISRKDWLRAGALAGIVGMGVALTNREEKFECSSRCGKCPKQQDGKCALGLK